MVISKIDKLMVLSATLNNGRNWRLLFAIVTFSLATFIWYDTSAHREAQTEITAAMSSAHWLARDKAVSADVQGLRTCNRIFSAHYAKDLERLPPAWRACLISTLPQMQTAILATVAAASAFSWLRENPNDEAVRQAALKAIDNGRRELSASKTWYYGRMDKLNEAHRASKILMMRNPPSDLSQFDYSADQLDQIEYRILLPDVAERQRKWRLSQLHRRPHSQQP